MQSEIGHLLRGLDESVAGTMSFQPVLSSIRQVLVERGIDADRVQLPMTQILGFRHPTLWGVILTWHRQRAFADTIILDHDTAAERGLSVHGPSDLVFVEDGVPRTPYFYVFGDRDWLFQCDLNAPPHDFPVFEEMRADGFNHYACFRLDMPATRTPAVISLSSEAPFPEDLRARLESLRGLLGLVVYAACRTSQAHKIAVTYVGPQTGPRVLDGFVVRGSSETVRAGVMFCDVRGFTALSARVGEQIVPIMNQIFEVIGAEAKRRDGEILKFIGDAMLLMFPIDAGSEARVAQAMVDTVTEALERVDEKAKELGYELAAGFGCHIGEVIYGNIGTPDRLDFTVMGSSVNLASRLESLCKTVQARGVFSAQVQAHCRGLEAGGAHQLKGIEEPVPVWIIR